MGWGSKCCCIFMSIEAHLLVGWAGRNDCCVAWWFFIIKFKLQLSMANLNPYLMLVMLVWIVY